VCRLDADGDQLAGAGDCDGLRDSSMEGRDVRDDVVGRERAEDRLGIATLEDRGGQADGRHGVPRRGLGHHGVACKHRQLAPDGVLMGRAGDDENAVLDER
jgi:hypothetical protein